MENVGKMSRRHPRGFTVEFKAEIVEPCQRGTVAWAGSPMFRTCS